jgi:hypothetical protein
MDPSDTTLYTRMQLRELKVGPDEHVKKYFSILPNGYVHFGQPQLDAGQVCDEYHSSMIFNATDDDGAYSVTLNKWVAES